MITRIVKVPVGNTGKGFITHDDQQVDGLSFVVPYHSATHAYCYVKVEDTLVQKAVDWLNRVGGTILTAQEAKDEIQADILNMPDDSVVCDRGQTHAINKAGIWQEVLDRVNSI